jgi:hypothetical protein
MSGEFGSVMKVRRRGGSEEFAVKWSKRSKGARHRGIVHMGMKPEDIFNDVRALKIGGFGMASEEGKRDQTVRRREETSGEIKRRKRNCSLML